MDPTERYERGLKELTLLATNVERRMAASAPRSKAKRIREMMEDEGMTRAEANAWFDAFEKGAVK